MGFKRLSNRKNDASFLKEISIPTNVEFELEKIYVKLIAFIMSGFLYLFSLNVVNYLNSYKESFNI